MKAALYFVAVLYFITVGCGITAVQRRTNIVRIESTIVNRQIVRFDGVYQRLSPSDYHLPIKYDKGVPVKFIDTSFLANPLIFFKSGDIFFNPSSFPEKSDFEYFIACNKNPAIYTNEGWGTYSITGNTVNAILYLHYLKSGFYPTATFLPCYFQGSIRGSDTLSNWRMIEPYPNFAKRYPYNKETIDYYKRPIELYFRRLIEIDSLVPTSAWTNKMK